MRLIQVRSGKFRYLKQADIKDRTDEETVFDIGEGFKYVLDIKYEGGEFQSFHKTYEEAEKAFLRMLV